MAKRPRRPAAETRAHIVDAAHTQLRAVGPAGLRLDEVAAEVGISRQAILHYFGSREGLMRAVVAQAWGGLFESLSALAAGAGELSPKRFLEVVDDVARRQGNARLGAWLLLSEQGLPDEAFEGGLAGLPGVLRGREQSVEERDASYTALLMGATVFGDAVFGERLRQVLGLPDSEEDREDFRNWLADRLLTAR